MRWHVPAAAGCLAAMMLGPMLGQGHPSASRPAPANQQVVSALAMAAESVQYRAKLRVPAQLRSADGRYRVTVTTSKRCTSARRAGSRTIRLACTSVPATGRVTVRVVQRRTGRTARIVVHFPPPTTSPAIPPSAQPGVGFTFLMTQPDGVTPVRWDPCDGPVVLSASGAATGRAHKQALTAAAGNVASATGLQVQIGSDSRFLPSPERPDDGDPGTDVVVWAGPRDSSPLLAASPGVAGYGGFTAQSRGDDPLVPKHGYVLIAADQADRMSRGELTRLYMHELGHVVGLGHVNDVVQVMNPTIVDDGIVWGVGDAAGLVEVGASKGCVIGR